eukprot:symbB.v1.2.035941.t1/scaffold4958.1/size32436/3
MYDTSKREWATFVVDDYVPVSKKYQQPFFVKSRHGSIWGQLLEKIFAKCTGSYGALDARQVHLRINPNQALTMMTGGVTFGHLRRSRTERNLWVLQFASLAVTTEQTHALHVPRQSSHKRQVCSWHGRRLDQYFQHQPREAYFVCCSGVDLQALHDRSRQGLVQCFFDSSNDSRGGGGYRGGSNVAEVGGDDQANCIISAAADEARRSDGIVPNHAYSVLRCVQVGEFKMLCMRNPWRYHEWNGRWSDGSEEWEEHPEVAEALQKETDNDGIFWMEFSDWKSVPVKPLSATAAFLDLMLPTDSKLRDITISPANLDFGQASTTRC